MCRNQNLLVFPLIFMLLIGGLSSVSAKPPPAKIISGLVSNVASMVWKWLWSLQSTATTTSTTKSAISSRSIVKFESGYNVETVFDGSKHGIEPYAVEVFSNGELLVLDSENSNIHKVSMPISRYGRPKLVSGSAEGYEGHVDGKLREAKMNHPRGLAVDDRGNVYVADTNNMVIRKISDESVSTIAGGRRGRGGHIDGPAEDAKFSDDFDIIYVAASCSILVIDRGHQAIREIQLHEADCSYNNNNNEQDDGDFHLGTAILVAAGFFGYMLALLQRRVRSLFSSSHDDGRYMVKPNMPMAPYQRYPRPVRPTLIPPDHEPENREEGFFCSLGKLIIKTISSVFEVFFGLLFGYRRKPRNFQYRHHYHPQGPNQWPIQESFVIPKEDEPPALEPRPCIPEKPYVGTEETNQIRSYYENQYQSQNQKQNVNNSKSNEQNCEKNEILFGAVQEQDGRRGAVMIRAVDFAGADAMNDRQNLRPRINYMGYSSHIY